MEKVSVVIVNWNGLHHLKKCLPSLTSVTYKNTEIIIVDNNSTDGSIEFIEKEFNLCKIVKNKKNLGFAGGNNAALPYISGEYVLFLNNDTIVTSNFIDELVLVLKEDPSIGGVQSQILSMDYPDRHDSVGAFLTNTGFLYHFGYFQKVNEKYNKAIPLYTAKGACMMFRKNVIDKVGLFDDDFFAYFEETDFCHRVWLAGYSIYYAPKSVIYHKVGGTSNSMNNSFIQFHSFKNRINSYIKNLGGIEMIKILPVHLLLCEISAFGFLFKKRPDLFISINKAIFWNAGNLGKTLRKRKKIQKKIRKVSDSQFFSTIKRNPGIKYYYFLFAKSLVGYKE